jgi:hypothetical protein
MAKKNGANGGPRKTSGQRYEDGRPFDVLRYLQAKLPLKSDRLSSIDQFREFGKLVQRKARSLNVDYIDDPDEGRSPRVREIIFVDTQDFRLYKNGFILRRRVPYVDGFPAGDPEIVFKFRYHDLQSAAALDVRPHITGKYQIKFKAQALPQNEYIGGYRVLYSHNCQFGISQVHEDDRTAMSTLIRIFPVLASLNGSDEDSVELVNESFVEELMLPIGRLDFGKGCVAKSNVALWRTRGDHRPIIGEYAFQLKFDRREDLPRKVENLVKQFFIELQHDVSDWVALGSTKTGLVYRLKNSAVERHE